jgi:hypothetical protein
MMPLEPTARATIVTTFQAIRIIEECLTGRENHAARPPYRSEWPRLIQGGNIFVYEESCSGIVDWDENQYLCWTKTFTVGSMKVDYRPTTIQGWPSTTLPSGLIRLTINVKRNGITHYSVAYQAGYALLFKWAMSHFLRAVAIISSRLWSRWTKVIQRKLHEKLDKEKRLCEKHLFTRYTGNPYTLLV